MTKSLTDLVLEVLNEDTTCASAFGVAIPMAPTSSQFSSDSIYAPGETRKAKILGKKKKVIKRAPVDTLFLKGKSKK